MAGLETVHKIVEKIEVQGAEGAERSFGRFADRIQRSFGRTANNVSERASGVADRISSAFDLGSSGEAATDAAGGLTDALEGLGIGGAGAAGAMGELAAMGEGLLAVAGPLTVVVGGLYAAYKALAFAAELAAKGLAHAYEAMWRTNEVYDDAEDKLTGLNASLTNLSKVADPIDRFSLAQKTATGLLSEFQATAMKTAMPLAEIAELGASLEPIWTAMGKSQWEVARATDALASAAKTLGVSTQEAKSSLYALLQTGRAGRQDPFGLALAAESGIKKIDKLEVRGEKLLRALEKIGAPVDQIASGTDEAIARWSIFTDDVLRRATKPAYEKIGEVVQKIVDWTERHSEQIDKIVGQIGTMTESFFAFLEGVWEAVVVTGTWFDDLFGISDVFEGWWKSLNKTVEWLGEVGKALKSLSSQDKEEAGKAWRGAINATSKRFLGVSLDELEETLRYKPGFDFQKPNPLSPLRERTALEQLADKAAPWSMVPSPEDQAGEERGRLFKSREDVKAWLQSIMSGKRSLFEMNIGEVNIQQDFRDQDPDRVMVEFRRDLEGLGERALQSTVGGAATVFGPGGTF